MKRKRSRQEFRMATEEEGSSEWGIEQKTFCLRDESGLKNQPIDPMTMELHANAGRNIEEAKKGIHQICDEIGRDNWRQHTKKMHPLGRIPTILRNNYNHEMTSQAYCKFMEIICTYPQLLTSNDGMLSSFHLCEGPGHFLLAIDRHLCTFRPDLNWNWQANTLNPWEETMSPTDKLLDDCIVASQPANWHFGPDDTGDILKWDSAYVQQIRDKFHGFDLVTADGSFYTQNAPAEQEQLVFPLLEAETKIGLALLKEGGSMVVKIYSMFNAETLDLFSNLIIQFRDVHVIKPLCSKAGNGEKYLILIGYNTLSGSSQRAIDDAKVRLMKCDAHFTALQIQAINQNIKTLQTGSSTKRITAWKNKQIADYLALIHAKELRFPRRNRWITPVKWIVDDGFESHGIFEPNYCETLKSIDSETKALECLMIMVQQSAAGFKVESEHHWPNEMLDFLKKSVDELILNKVITTSSIPQPSPVLHSMFINPKFLHSIRIIDPNVMTDWFSGTLICVKIYDSMEDADGKTYQLQSRLDALAILLQVCKQVDDSVVAANMATYLENLIQRFPDGNVTSFVPLSILGRVHKFIHDINRIQYLECIRNTLGLGQNDRVVEVNCDKEKHREWEERREGGADGWTRNREQGSRAGLLPSFTCSSSQSAITPIIAISH
ncbi:hypothetical protein WR25_18266 [Diploscapter pachys]|uniref:Cap-specific mRNA (nucleoside-2'-O-)-methyltransferase 2 n=1 Tax=Diploscapter pachys TaxID=2018661 RepID=A0A2A2LMC1_9BILA|nr:hypothetical protein WR25_18266 [Diploscapter pachys]